VVSGSMLAEIIKKFGCRSFTARVVGELKPDHPGASAQPHGSLMKSQFLRLRSAVSLLMAQFSPRHHTMCKTTELTQMPGPTRTHSSVEALSGLRGVHSRGRSLSIQGPKPPFSRDIKPNMALTMDPWFHQEVQPRVNLAGDEIIRQTYEIMVYDVFETTAVES
jgi:hypothetical protein